MPRLENCENEANTKARKHAGGKQQAIPLKENAEYYHNMPILTL